MLRLAVALTFVVSVWPYPVAAVSGDSLPSYVAPRHRHAIAAWLSHHPTYRLAVDADCSCADDIAHVRAGNSPEWPPLPDYHPYYTVGDFRGDGAEDVAVGVISPQHRDKFRVLIIHGAPTKGRSAQTFLSEELDLRQGLFYGAPRPKPWRLLVGPFESDGVTLEPTPGGYKFSNEDSDDE